MCEISDHVRRFEIIIFSLCTPLGGISWRLINDEVRVVGGVTVNTRRIRRMKGINNHEKMGYRVDHRCCGNEPSIWRHCSFIYKLLPFSYKPDVQVRDARLCALQDLRVMITTITWHHSDVRHQE